MYDCCVVVNFAYARAHYASNALAKSQKPTRARKLAQQQKKRQRVCVALILFCSTIKYRS